MGNLSGVVQHLRKERERAQKEVDRMDAALAALGSSKSGSPMRRQRRTMSAAARRKISLAQKARWAKTRPNRQTGTAKPRRALSAVARRKISAAQRARWAKWKAAQKKAA